MSQDKKSVSDDELDESLGEDDSDSNSDNTDNSDTSSDEETNSESDKSDELLDEYGNSKADDEFEADDEDSDESKDYKAEAKTYKKRYGDSAREAQKILKEKNRLAKELEELKSKSSSNPVNEEVKAKVLRIEAEMNKNKIEFIKGFESKHSEVKFTPDVRNKVGKYVKILLESGVPQSEAYEKGVEHYKLDAGIKSVSKTPESEVFAASIGGGASGYTSPTPKKDVPDDEMQEVFNQAGVPQLGPLEKSKK